MDAIVTVPVLTEHGRHLVSCEIVLKHLWLSHIFVIEQASVFSRLSMVSGEHGMHFVPVSIIRAIEQCTKMRRALVCIISTSVRIVEIKAKTKSFVGIDRKLCVDMVFAIEFVATVIVNNIGNRRQCIGKVIFVWLKRNVVVWLHKGKLVSQRTVDDNTVDTGRVIIANSVILTIESSIEYCVHKEMLHGIGLCRCHVTKTSVDSPYTKPLGNLFVFCGIVIVLVKVAVCRVVVHPHTIVVQRIIHLLEALRIQ